MILPDIGHVTFAVVNSPTAPLSGVHSETKALKEYAEIIRVVNDMREKEELKKIARGGNSVSSLMDKDD